MNKQVLIALIFGSAIIGFSIDAYAAILVCPPIITFQCVPARDVRVLPNIPALRVRSTCRINSTGAVSPLWNFVAPDVLINPTNRVPNPGRLVAIGVGLSSPSGLIPGQYTAFYQFSFYGRVFGSGSEVAYCLYMVRNNPNFFAALYSQNLIKGISEVYGVGAGNWVPRGSGFICTNSNSAVSNCVFSTPVFKPKPKTKRF